MALTTVYLGRYTSGSPESDTGEIGANASRATVFDASSYNLWAIHGGFIGGKQTSNVSARMSVYNSDASKNPLTRQGYMASVTVSTIMVGGGDGTEYTANVSVVDSGPATYVTLAIPLSSGVRYAIDIISGNYAMRHSMIAAASISADNEQFYNRTAPSNPPPTSYGAYSASIEGHMTSYLKTYRNEVPLAPSTGIAPEGNITSLTPTFTADFDDLCGAHGVSSGLGLDLGDEVKQYKIQVRQVGTTSLIWNATYTASSAEKAADAISKAYGGTALTRGVSYEWRIRMSDWFGEWSDYSDNGVGTGWFVFTPVSLGYVTLDDVPTGKQESTTPANFNGRWNHQSATTMKTCQVRILASDGVTVVQTGSVYDIADVASSALPGTLFSIPWASSGLTALSPGVSYYYQIQGYDGTNWSGYSTARSFSINAAPTIPGSLTPNTSQLYSGTSYPKLECTFTDSDDTTATGLTGVFRITRPDLTTVDVTPTYNATTAKWEYQTTIVEINQVGIFTWKATGYDGTFYSGEVAALVDAVWSGAVTFDYETGPSVVVTAPTDGSTLTASAILVTWTCANQAKYQVRVYPDGSSTSIYDSGLIVSTAQNMTIPAGRVPNGAAYDLIVTITDTTPLTGNSVITNFTMSITPPTAPVNFQGAVARFGYDSFDTGIRLSWDQTAYSIPEFLRYSLRRSASGGPDAAEILLAELSSPGLINFIDYIPASEYVYTYSLSVITTTGTDELESDRVTAEVSVTLVGTVLSAVNNGGTLRSCLLNVTERSHGRRGQETVYTTLGSAKPVTVTSQVDYWESAYKAALISDTYATAKQRVDELETLALSHEVLCARDSMQRKRFVRLNDFEVLDQKIDWYYVSFKLREEDATEGIP